MLPENIQVVCLSRRRELTILKHTLALMPYAHVTVEDDEMDAYAQAGVPEEQLVPHPHFETLAELRNWINLTFPSEFVIQVHDDLRYLRSIVGWRPRYYRDPYVIAQLLERTAICARDAGCFLFGFGNIAAGPPNYNKMKPFRLNGYVRNVIGFVEGHGLEWDPATIGHHDVDIALQSFVKHRIVWRDERWVFDDVRLGSNKGGAQGMRTEARLAQGRVNLLRKWGGGYVKFQTRRDHRGSTVASTTEATVIRVRRTDPAVRQL